MSRMWEVDPETRAKVRIVGEINRKEMYTESRTDVACFVSSSFNSPRLTGTRNVATVVHRRLNGFVAPGPASPLFNIGYLFFC